MTSQQLIANEPFAGKYELLELIDSGGFANVWRAKHIQGGNEVALKIYAHQNTEGSEIFKQEYAQFANLRHQALANASDFDVADGCPFLVMPYYSGGNAGQLIGKFTEKEAAHLMRQVGDALAYLHERNVMHQDIKPNNFLLDNDGNFVLSDLGLSFKTRTTMLHPKGNATTSLNSQKGSTPPCYRAPELFGNKNKIVEPIKATDMWAFGASLFELITGEVPFGELGGIEQIADPSVPNISTAVSTDLKNIVTWCLDKETWNRPTAAKLVEWARHFESTGAWFAKDDAFVSKKRGGIKPTPAKTIQPTGGSSVVTPSVSWRKWAVAAVVLLMAGFGISKIGSFGNAVTPAPATAAPAIVGVPFVVEQKTPTPTPEVVSAKTISNGVEKPKEKPSQVIEKTKVEDPPKPSEPNIPIVVIPTVYSPIDFRENILDKTKGIYMTRLWNEDGETIISFLIPKKSEKSAYSLQSKPFNLIVDGVRYDCKDDANASYVATKGKEIPEGGVSFSVHYKQIPNTAKQVRIMERSIKVPGSTYWLFEFDLPTR